MAYNFGGTGNNNVNPRFTAQQSYTGMTNFQQQQQGSQTQQGFLHHGYQQTQPQGYHSGIGQFPGDMVRPQMQHMYNQQQQQQQQLQQQQLQQQQYHKMIEQQQKMAQQNQKMQTEMRKKRDFEMQQKKLQQFGQGGGIKRGGGSDLSHLIGSLAQRNTDKPASSKHQVTSSHGRSLFARPGTSYPPPSDIVHHSDHLVHPEGPQHTVQQQPYMGSAFGGVSGIGSDTFGQTNDGDDDFNDFQEAQPSSFPCPTPNIATSTSLAPSGISSNKPSGPEWPNQPGNQPVHSMPGQMGTGGSLVSTGMSSDRGWPNHSGINNATVSSSWGMQGHTPNMVSSTSSSFQGMVTHTTSAMLVSMVTSQRERADSQSSASSNSSCGLQSVQGMGQHEGHVRQSNMPTYFPNDARQRQGSFTSPMPGMPEMTSMPHGMQVTSNMATIMPSVTGQQLASQQILPGQVVVPDDDDSCIEEESEEAKLERLYGITIPDWCSQGQNLPGVYKDVKEAATLNGATDTCTLYPILLASELHRDVLGQIWSRVNKATPGQLNDMELRMMLGLIALGQTGLKVERLTLDKLATCKSAPIPSIPEDILKPSEGSWSFQKENTQFSQDDSRSSSTMPLQMGINEDQSGSILNNTSQPHECSAFKSVESDTIKEGFGGFANWSVPNSSVNSIMTQSIMQGQSSPRFQGFKSAEISSEANSDFGDFQGSASSIDSIVTTTHKTTTVADFTNLQANTVSNVAVSLESFQLKTEQSLFNEIKPSEWSLQNDDGSAAEFSDFASFSSAESISKSSHDEGIHGNKNDNFAAFPVLTMPPRVDSSLTLKIPASLSKSSSEKKEETGLPAGSTPQEGITKTADKYDFLRDLGGETSVFSVSPTSRNKDDNFGDFESFEQVEPAAAEHEFGDFQSIATSGGPPTSAHQVLTSSNTKSSDEWGFNAFSSVTSQFAKNELNFSTASSSGASNNLSNTIPSQDDFGDFSEFQSSHMVGGSPNIKQDMNGVMVGGFGADDDSCKQSRSIVNFTNTVPLDYTQRYKQLCGEEEDADQHANVWGRCLNSCLLILATCAVAVQTMSDPTIKQEVLQSKKGMEYFTAIIEIFKVTKRVQVSLIKTDLINEKLKTILEEMNQTWKNIANFLTGTNLESNIGRENFSDHHVQTDEDKMIACGLCLLNVNKTTDTKLAYGGREYHSTCANFWCNRVDSILPSLWPVNSLI